MQSTYIQKLSPHLGKHVSKAVRNYVPNTQTPSPNFPYFGRIIVNNSERMDDTGAWVGHDLLPNAY